MFYKKIQKFTQKMFKIIVINHRFLKKINNLKFFRGMEILNFSQKFPTKNNHKTEYHT